MSRDSSGTFTLAPSNPVISGTIIETAWANGTLSDIAAALTDSLSRSGKGGMAAPLDMGGYRIVSIGPAAAMTDAPQAGQVRDQSFTWLNPAISDAGGNNYIGTALLATAPNNGTAYQLLADRNNSGAMTLAVNGGAALPIQIHGAPTPPGLVLAGAVLEVVYYNLTYRLVSVSSGGGTIATVQSTDPDVISVVNDTGTGIATLTPHTNVALGTVKLDGSAKVPVSQLPFTTLQFVGIWNATPGTNPPSTGRVTGDYFIITVAGSLTLYRDSGGNVYTPQVTAVAVGAAIIWNAAGTVNQPTGWYYDPAAAAPGVASTTSMNQTSANAPFAGKTNVQAWLDVADPAILARLPFTGGTMTGPILSAAVPSAAAELANKQYVDTKTASLVGVLSFNARTGAVVLASTDVTTALGYTPANKAGDTFSGNISVAGTVSATGVIGALAFVPAFFVNAAFPASGLLDFVNGQSQKITLTANTVLTAINNIPAGSIMRVILEATTFTVTWPASVVWPLGVAPSLAAGPLKKAIVVLEALTGGGTLFGSATVY